MTAPDKTYQVGGDHYARHAIQPWDIIEEYRLDFWLGNVIKYVLRHKPGETRLVDLQKARHYLDKRIAMEDAALRAAHPPLPPASLEPADHYWGNLARAAEMEGML